MILKVCSKQNDSMVLCPSEIIYPLKMQDDSSLMSSLSVPQEISLPLVLGVLLDFVKGCTRSVFLHLAPSPQPCKDTVRMLSDTCLVLWTSTVSDATINSWSHPHPLLVSGFVLDLGL